LERKRKKTRIGYKDRQKREAVIEMKHVGDALSLHQAVLERAKELFAGFRDDRELVQQFKGVLAACLCEAFDQLSKDGRQILKVKAGEGGSNEKDDEEESEKSNITVVKQSRLHSATLSRKISGSTAIDSAISTTEKKSASKWDLDDARSWLLEASRRIARKWKQQESDQTADDMSKRGIPQGSTEELEGKLVGHTLTLCDIMETELKNGDKSRMGKQSVVTPRVAEMGRLGIKFQHSHERGSGGAGGVGNSGLAGGMMSQKLRKKTAGQILILKSAKRLGEAIKDPIAGEAFHCEVRALLQRQEKEEKEKRSIDTLKRRLNKKKQKFRRSK